YEADMEETRAPNIRRPPRARESQENHRRDNRGPHPEKGRGGPGGGPQAPPAAGHTRANRPWARQGGQAPPSNRRERASAHPSILPWSEKPATHRRPGASSTGRA
ncbi:hypothetical protein M9458_029152, partial [Cirrhinus mrigala]